MVNNKIDSKRRIISIVIYIIMTSVLTQIDQITKYIAETNLYDEKRCRCNKECSHIYISSK